jgi:ribosomal protein S18 acetylase RimI-like enzyme
MIAAATSADEAALLALWQICGLTVPQNDPAADFRVALGKPNSDILVARDGSGAVIASVMVGHDGHRGWIYYVAVLPDWRGGGLGRALMDAAESWLARHGLPKAQLMIRDTNLAVRAFYERLGYQAVPRVVLQKALPPKG